MIGKLQERNGHVHLEDDFEETQCILRALISMSLKFIKPQDFLFFEFNNFKTLATVRFSKNFPVKSSGYLFFIRLRP